MANQPATDRHRARFRHGLLRSYLIPPRPLLFARDFLRDLELQPFTTLNKAGVSRVPCHLDQVRHLAITSDFFSKFRK